MSAISVTSASRQRGISRRTTGYTQARGRMSAISASRLITLLQTCVPIRRGSTALMWSHAVPALPCSQHTSTRVQAMLQAQHFLSLAPLSTPPSLSQNPPKRPHPPQPTSLSKPLHPRQDFPLPQTPSLSRKQPMW